MPLTPEDFDALFLPGSRHVMSGGDVVTVTVRREAELWLPTGRVVAVEPWMVRSDSPEFVQQVTPGVHPVELVVVVYDEHVPSAADMVAAARLVVRDEPAVSWEMALLAGQSLDDLSEEGYYGYPVDGATGGFADAGNLAELDAGGLELIDSVLHPLVDGVLVERDHTEPGTVTDSCGRPLMVVFSTGCGDGFYPTWVGRSANGEITCFLTDFFVLPDEEVLERSDAGDRDDTGATAQVSERAAVPSAPLRGAGSSLADHLPAFEAATPAGRLLDAADFTEGKPAI